MGNMGKVKKTCRRQLVGADRRLGPNFGFADGETLRTLTLWFPPSLGANHVATLHRLYRVGGWEGAGGTFVKGRKSNRAQI